MENLAQLCGCINSHCWKVAMAEPLSKWSVGAVVPSSPCVKKMGLFCLRFWTGFASVFSTVWSDLCLSSNVTVAEDGRKVSSALSKKSVVVACECVCQVQQ